VQYKFNGLGEIVSQEERKKLRRARRQLQLRRFKRLGGRLQTLGFIFIIRISLISNKSKSLLFNIM
jgi:hypothetical protein